MYVRTCICVWDNVGNKTANRFTYEERARWYSEKVISHQGDGEIVRPILPYVMQVCVFKSGSFPGIVFTGGRAQRAA